MVQQLSKEFLNGKEPLSPLLVRGRMAPRSSEALQLVPPAALLTMALPDACGST